MSHRPLLRRLSIAAARADHDRLLREAIAPVFDDLTGAYFERFNKPDWGIRLHVQDGECGIAETHLTRLGVGFASIDDDQDDKWIGGPDDEPVLRGIHHHDSSACLGVLEAEAAGSLATTRAQWSLLAVEEIVDLFELAEPDRLDFYRRGFQWSADLGRWDAEVFAALESKYASQQAALRAVIQDRESDDDTTWGGGKAARLAQRLVTSLRAPIASMLEATAAGRIARTPVEWAVLVGHAHSNRLGIVPTQEATMRYLVWRARGGTAMTSPSS